MNEKVKHIDTLVKICGFFVVGAEVNNGYGCNHPKQEEFEIIDGKKHGMCHRHSCPIAIALRPNEYAEDREHFAGEEWNELTDEDWLLIHDKTLISKLLVSK